MTNSDGSNLAADAKAGLVYYPIVSLFQQVDFFLKGNLKGCSTNTYAYRDMLDVLLGYDQGAKNSYLTIELYSKDIVMKMDLVTVDGANGGLKARSRYIKENKLVEVSGLLHCDLVNSDCLLLKGLPLKIVLYQQRDIFILMADDASKDCRVCITGAQLCTRYANLSDEKYRNIQQS